MHVGAIPHEILPMENRPYQLRSKAKKHGFGECIDGATDAQGAHHLPVRTEYGGRDAGGALLGLAQGHVEPPLADGVVQRAHAARGGQDHLAGGALVQW
jgi:hypothetical protein